MKGDSGKMSPDTTRPSSRSPLQDSTNKAHHRSSQAIYTNGKDSNGTTNTMTHHPTTKNLKDTQHRAISTEMGDLTAPGETKTKKQMARAFQESQELYKTADSKSGLQTVKTRRVLTKKTIIRSGENEKVSLCEDLFCFVLMVCFVL